MDYVTVKSDILNILATNPSLTNLGRSLAVKQPDLHAWVMANPPALPDEAGFNERLFCIANDIETRPQCPFTGTVLKFINFSKGYRKINKDGKGFTPVVFGDTAVDFSVDEILYLHEDALTIIERFGKFKTGRPDLYKKIMSIPGFGDARFTERLYAVINDICERPIERFRSFPLGYTNSGYARAEIRDISQVEIAQRVGSECPRHGSKVKKFLKMNADRNAALYDLPDDRENIDFVVCPVLGIRTLNIKKKYIEGVLLMTEWDFEARFPDQQRSCSGHSARIAEGLAQEIDGVTRHAFGSQKATKIRRLVGEDGLTPNQRLGINTRRTHMENIDENGLNGYQRIASYRNETLLPCGRSVQQVALQKRYKTLVEQGWDFSGTYRRASQLSKTHLSNILDVLTLWEIQFYFDENEYLINDDGKIYFYDLVIPSLYLCIEYQSRAYHPNPEVLTESEWSVWRPVRGEAISADEKLNYDIEKAKSLFRRKGFATWFVWQDTQIDDVKMIMEYLEQNGCVKQ
jgi:hypothetical protein